MTKYWRSAAAAALAVVLGACVRDVDDQADTTAAGATASAGSAAVAIPQPPPEPTMRIEVDLASRQLRVLRGGTAAQTYPVAVGTEKWPTQTGSWTITQVVWNPEWVPPREEEWAKDEKPKDPGASDNPLGRVQLVYDPPRTIHGTNEPASIGKAASHGSIRMRNEDAEALARDVMAAGGVQRDEAWFTERRTRRTQKEIVDLPNPVPIVVR